MSSGTGKCVFFYFDLVLKANPLCADFIVALASALSLLLGLLFKFGFEIEHHFIVSCSFVADVEYALFKYGYPLLMLKFWSIDFARPSNSIFNACLSNLRLSFLIEL